MLRSLSVRDVVLIRKLDLSFDGGLTVLTGETGAGKSILLDALGLALGVRAEARLVRQGAEQASVTAAFDLPPGHEVHDLLNEQGLDAGEETLILRRSLGKDGRSRAFVNDQPVSVALLRSLGEALVEIHGQFESRRLLDPAMHRHLLDAKGELGPRLGAVKMTYHTWTAATARRREAEAALEQARSDEDFLRHSLGELDALNPEPGEEKDLARRRTVMMLGEKLVESLGEAQAELTQGRGTESALQGALRALSRVADKTEGRLDDTMAALERAAGELTEAMAGLEKLSASVDLDPRNLERIEERLFALRGLSRKHGVDVDSLDKLQAKMAAQLAALEDGGADLQRLDREEAAARAAYVEAAEGLSTVRAQAARTLDASVMAELEPLKLGRAVFKTGITRLDEGAWGEHGLDRITFEVATNPGSPLGPIRKIASGGELARFMLALKVVLANADPVPTLVFDEVDAGIGGATASAVGERLLGLGRAFQVLVVTHSPQVAALGTQHWQVAKAEDGDGVFTTVHPLDAGARQEEVARMLAGAEVTDQARAAADSLIGAGVS